MQFVQPLATPSVFLGLLIVRNKTTLIIKPTVKDLVGQAILTHMVKECPSFVRSEGSVLYSQKHFIGDYPEQV
jgi:hypothetical protein